VPPSSLDDDGAPLLGFLALQRHQRGSPLHTGFPAPGYVPASGFRTLLPASSSPRLPGLFHPGGTPGLRPSGASPPEEPYRLLDGRCPLGVRCRIPTCLDKSVCRRRVGDPFGSSGADLSCLQGLAPLESPFASA
jgi:hypothetical protein